MRMMARINISVPDELKGRMDAYDESVNWSQVATAAAELKLCASDIQSFGIADEVIPEPAGGGHRDPEGAVANLLPVLTRHLAELRRLSTDELLDQRYAKYRTMGVYKEL